MQVRKIKAGGVNTTLENFVGEHGTLFYDSTLGNLRLSDGHTPGGITVTTIAPATTSTLGGIQVGAGLSIDNTGTLSVISTTTLTLDSLNVGTLNFTNGGPSNLASGNDLTLSAAGLIRLTTAGGTWTFEEDGSVQFPDGTLQYTAYQSIPLNNLNMDGGGAGTVYGVELDFVDGGSASTRFGSSDTDYDGNAGPNYTLDGGRA
jgi:hypothetical protein